MIGNETCCYLSFPFFYYYLCIKYIDISHQCNALYVFFFISNFSYIIISCVRFAHAQYATVWSVKSEVVLIIHLHHHPWTHPTSLRTCNLLYAVFKHRLRFVLLHLVCNKSIRAKCTMLFKEILYFVDINPLIHKKIITL